MSDGKDDNDYFKHITFSYGKTGRIGKGTNILAFVEGRSTGFNDMDVGNGVLAVMYATISYHTYSSINRCDLAYATSNRVGGSGI